VRALPDLPAIEQLLERLTGLAQQAHGTVLVLAAQGRTEEDRARLEPLYAEAREQEWSEFRADCGKYHAELDKEEALGKYTLAELEEEEQSLDRLRRWYRESRSRDLLGSHAFTESATELKRCEGRFDTYAEQIYAKLGTPHE
jgi:hypothetical protein